MKKNIKKYRQEIIDDLCSLTFAQKRKVLKQADKIVLDNATIIKALNTFTPLIMSKDSLLKIKKP